MRGRLVKTFEQLLDDLVNQAVLEVDLEEWSRKFVNLRSAILTRYVQMEGRVAHAAQRDEAGPVQAVRGKQDSPGRLRREDLPDVRRVASDPGTPDRATPATTGHHVMISTSMLAVGSDPPEDAGRFTSIWPARFYLWACGPHQAQGCGATPEERSRQIADHCA